LSRNLEDSSRFYGILQHSTLISTAYIYFTFLLFQLFFNFQLSTHIYYSNIIILYILLNYTNALQFLNIIFIYYYYITIASSISNDSPRSTSPISIDTVGKALGSEGYEAGKIVD
jgi:Na+/serine symporter